MFAPPTVDSSAPADSGTIPLSTGPLPVGQIAFACDQDGVPTALNAEITPAGDVGVRHELAFYECLEALLLQVEATLLPATGEIELVYNSTHNTNDCTNCDMDVSYVLTGVPPGTWTLVAGPVRTAIVVP